MTPPIAVVTACRNYAEYLPECMASVRAQSWTDYEHVVVDDGSTDGSRELAWEAGQRDGRLLAVPLGRQHGFAEALNIGYARTRAPWILKLDADDTIEPTYLERILGVAFADPRLNVIFSWCHLFGTQDSVYRYQRFDPLLMADVFMLPGPAAIRRELWLAVRGFRSLACAEDWDLYVRAQVAVGLVPYQIPAALWNYRQHDSPARLTRHGQDKLPEYQAMWRAMLAEGALNSLRRFDQDAPPLRIPFGGALR